MEYSLNVGFLRKGANTFELKANSSGAGDLYLDNIVIERK